ncbi:MAG: hypothetical protein ABS910_05770 [Arthrobacter sp.]
MKPLELTIYPLREKVGRLAQRGYVVGKRGVWEYMADRMKIAKRFTDAELAAEWHANEVEAWRMVGRRPEFYNVDVAEKLESRESTLRRFAAAPHYFEEQE